MNMRNEQQKIGDQLALKCQAHILRQQQKRRRRKRQAYILVAIVAVAIMGFSISGIGEAPMLFNISSTDNNIMINSYREGTPPPLSSPEDINAVYKKIEQIFGFEPIYLTYLPKGTQYVGETVNVDMGTAFMEYTVSNRKIKYEVYISNPKITGDAVSTLLNGSVHISIYKNDFGYLAAWTYKDIYYCIRTDISIDELEKILKSLMMYTSE